MTRTILILGGSGRFGRHATDAFEGAGWKVRQFNRKTDTLETAMQGADIVLNAWNPPGYHLWEDHLLELHKPVARAAAQADIPVILPGNVYVYGPEAPMPWGIDTPHLATNPLARLRKAAEATYPEAGARLIVLRCGDFIDGTDSGNWFESHIAKKARKGVIRYPGDPQAPHAWAYLPDAARATVRLAEIRDTLAPVEEVPFEGYTLSGAEMGAAIERALGHEIRVKPFPWGMLRLLRPFMPMLGGLFEMRYLWSLPHRLDGSHFRGLVPDFAPTSVDDALCAALAFSAPGRG